LYSFYFTNKNSLQKMNPIGQTDPLQIVTNQIHLSIKQT
jgi:hypothetical protein